MRIEERTISRGTSNFEDLLPVFLEFLGEISPEGLTVEGSTVRWKDGTSLRFGTGIESLVQLIDLLDKLVQEASLGFYRFGTHPGDGSDWGVWRQEEEDEWP